MPLQFTPIAFGIMLVVAIGTIAYTVFNSNRQSQQSYGSSNSFDYGCGYDTYGYKRSDGPDDGQRRRKKRTHDQCSICLDVMKDKLRTLPCQHIFHEQCIKMWFVSNNTCPICRTSSSNTQ